MIVALRALQLPAEKQAGRDRRCRNCHLIQMAGQENNGTVLIATSFGGDQFFDKLIVRDVRVDRVSQPTVQGGSSTTSIV